MDASARRYLCVPARFHLFRRAQQQLLGFGWKCLMRLGAREFQHISPGDHGTIPIECLVERRLKDATAASIQLAFRLRRSQT